MSESKKITSFEDLECWKACRVVRNQFSKMIKTFPVEEKYALSDGIRRASRSITENIAEGFGRFHFQENIQFCRISRGSLFELKDQLITALDEKYINDEEYNLTNELIARAISILNGYIKYLGKAKVADQYNSKNSFHEPFTEYLYPPSETEGEVQ